MRAMHIILLDHYADLGGPADIEAAHEAATEYVDTFVGAPEDGWIEPIWTASEALDDVCVEPGVGDDPHAVETYDDARRAFLGGSAFATAALGVEHCPARRAAALDRVLAEITATAATNPTPAVLSSRLRVCADWMETGLPGVSPENQFMRLRGGCCDMRSPRIGAKTAAGPWVLVRFDVKF